MPQAVTTFTDFVLEEEHQLPHATGNFTLLLIQIEQAARIIASHIKASGLVDILGTTGKKNSFQEEVQKLDEFANMLLVKNLTQSGQTFALISEEMPEPLFTPKAYAGDYVVFFDPLDGSSNIDVNAPIGSIFSIYKKSDSLLQPGKKQLAAGYILYGSSVMLVYTTGKGVNGFTLDPAMGSFLLSHKDIQIPETGTTYSLNEAYFPFYDTALQDYLTNFKQKPKASARYIGSMIADVHRTLLKGGIFLYPTDTNHPQGKLRLMLEVNPMSLLISNAGGLAVAIKEDPLEIVPTHIHERAPITLGSKKLVEEYLAQVQQKQ